MVKGDSEPREKTGVETSIDERRAAASSPNFGKSDRVGTHPRFGCTAIADGFHPDGHAGSSSELSAAHAAPERCNGSKDSPAPLPDASVSARLRLRQMTHRYRRFMAAGKNSDIGVDCKRRCCNTRPQQRFDFCRDVPLLR